MAQIWANAAKRDAVAVANASTAALPAQDKTAPVTESEFNRAFAVMLEEVKAGRAYIKALEAEREAQQKLLSQQERVIELQATIVSESKADRELLREAVAKSNAAYEAQKAATEELRKTHEIAKERVAKIEKSQTRRLKIAGVVAMAAFIAGLAVR